MDWFSKRFISYRLGKNTTPVAVVSSFVISGQFLSFQVIIIHVPRISLIHLVGVTQFIGTVRILLPKLGSHFMTRKISRIVSNLRQVSVRSSLNGRTKTLIPNGIITLIKYQFIYIYLIGLDILWESLNDNTGCNWSFEMLFQQGFVQMIQACFWNNFNYTLSNAQHMTWGENIGPIILVISMSSSLSGRSTTQLSGERCDADTVVKWNLFIFWHHLDWWHITHPHSLCRFPADE